MVLGQNAAPPLPAGTDLNNENNYPAIADAHIDLIVQAFQKGLTQVATLSFGDVDANPGFRWAMASSPYHDAAHLDAAVNRSSLERAQLWYAVKFAALVGKLNTIPERGGTMLDNTLVVWLSETGEASGLTGDNIPVVLAGRLGGRVLRTNRFLTVPPALSSQSLLLSSIAQAFGLNFLPTGLGTHPAFVAP